VTNALSTPGIERSDIRASFGRGEGVAHGVPLTLSLWLVDANDVRTPLPGYAVYVWQCTADGLYSMYTDGIPGENFLRGVQGADAKGRVTFRTIFPGCYWGRYPHIHFEVYPNLETATSYHNKVLSSQMAMPREIASAIYSQVSAYAESLGNLGSITTSSDELFGDNTAAELSAMTPKMSGDMKHGYSATLVIGLTRSASVLSATNPAGW
jgi:protocatechuate 3,4-dioxygenase beta subunit